MATRTVCDGGCGEETRNAASFREFGFVRKKQYCKACAADVGAVYVEIDMLHTRVAEEWSHGHIELRAAFHRKHPNSELPDE